MPAAPGKGGAGLHKTPNRIWTDTAREIRNTRSRFLSILVLSALAVAFLAGLRTTAPDMERSADRYFDEHNLMDVEVLSTLGLTESDILALKNQSDISAAEGAFTADAVAHVSGNDSIVKLCSLSEQGINTPRLVSGRMPERSDECLAEPKFLSETGLNLGDTVTLDTGTGTFQGALNGSMFTIVGTADSPLYIDIERGSSSLGTGKVSAFLLLPRSAFAMGYYTEAYLTVDRADGLMCYDQAYKDLISAVTGVLEPLGSDRAGLRYAQVKQEAEQKLSDARKEHDDARKETDQKLSDARQSLKDSRKKLDDGWQEYHDGTAALDEEISGKKQELSEALSGLEQGELDYADGQKKLDDGQADYENGLKEQQDGEKQYEDALPDLVQGEQEYNDSLKKLQDGEADYQEGLKEYNNGLTEIQDGAQQLVDAKKELDRTADELFSGDEQYSEGLSEYNAQVAQLNSLLTPILAAAGYTGTTGGELVDRMNDPAYQPSDWAVLDGTRAALEAKAAADIAAPEELALLTALNAYFPNEAAYLTTAAALGASRSQLEASKNSLDFGELAYHDGLRQYYESQTELMENAQKLENFYPQLADARSQLDDGWAKLRKGRRKLDENWAELDKARRKLVDGQEKLDAAWADLVSGRQELADSRKKLDDGWQEYWDGKARLADQTAEAQQKLSDAYRELIDGEANYRAGLADYESGKSEADEKLSDAQQKLSDAGRKVSEIESCKWYILGREANLGYAAFESNSQRMANLASVFPVIFFLVAALVCLTTMTRMVEEQRLQIGCLKALGYRRRDIAVKYVGYGFFSSAAGGVLGLFLGCTAIPLTIYTAWGTLYTLGSLVVPVYPLISSISVLAAVAVVTLSALAACFSALAAVPAQLMRPKAPPAGKRVLLERVRPVWRRLSFARKVAVRNLFRYKKRFWMTVIGIGGCTALLVAGFGLRNSLFDVLDLQYGKIDLYSARIGLADHVTQDELAGIGRVLDESGVSRWALFRQESITVKSGTNSVDASLLAPADENRLGDFIRLVHRKDGASVTLGSDGAVITEKLASLLHVSAGDTIRLDGDGEVEVSVADITENYILHDVYLSGDYYAKVYGAQPEGNLILASYADDTKKTADSISSVLIPLSGVTDVTRVADTRETYHRSMQSINYAVMVVTVSAAALAFVVLYNLTSINITERRRELATLKVLGFFDRELDAYVHRENILLTLFGLFLGLVLGKYLHQWLVLTVEIDMLMFGRTVHPLSYCFAAALTVLFSLLVNLFAGRRLRKIDMVESLKTVE